MMDDKISEKGRQILQLLVDHYRETGDRGIYITPEELSKRLGLEERDLGEAMRE